MEAMSWGVVCTALVKHAREGLMQSGRGARSVSGGALFQNCLSDGKKNPLLSDWRLICYEKLFDMKPVIAGT